MSNFIGDDHENSVDPRAQFMDKKIGKDVGLLLKMLLSAMEKRDLPGFVAIEAEDFGLMLAGTKEKPKMPVMNLMRDMALSSITDGCGIDGILIRLLTEYKDAPFVKDSPLLQVLQHEVPEEVLEKSHKMLIAAMGEQAIGLGSLEDHESGGGKASSMLKQAFDSIAGFNPFDGKSESSDDSDLKRKEFKIPSSFDGDYEALPMDQKIDFVDKLKDVCKATKFRLVNDGTYFKAMFDAHPLDDEIMKELEIEKQEEDGESFHVLNLSLLYEKADKLKCLGMESS